MAVFLTIIQYEMLVESIKPLLAVTSCFTEVKLSGNIRNSDSQGR